MNSVREGEGGKIWENGIETCKISCMKRVASPGSMHDTGCLGLVHWDHPEGWYGEGGGRREEGGGRREEGGGFRMGNTCIPVVILKMQIKNHKYHFTSLECLLFKKK